MKHLFEEHSKIISTTFKIYKKHDLAKILEIKHSDFVINSVRQVIILKEYPDKKCKEFLQTKEFVEKFKRLEILRLEEWFGYDKLLFEWIQQDTSVKLLKSGVFYFPMKKDYLVYNFNDPLYLAPKDED